MTDDTTVNLGKIVGADGSNGTNGTDGLDGKTPIFKLDDNGDIYVRYDENEEWTLLGNIMGQAGEDGEDGEDGDTTVVPVGGQYGDIVIILIAVIAVVAIGLSTVAMVMVTRYNYKPWWMI